MVEKPGHGRQLCFVICGSVIAHGEPMAELAKILREMGHAVVDPGIVPYPHTHDPSEKTANRKAYYHAIEVSDAVICFNGSEEHIGFETACEVGYAIARVKPLYFTHPSNIDGVKALLSDGTANYFDIWRVTHL